MHNLHRSEFIWSCPTIVAISRLGTIWLSALLASCVALASHSALGQSSSEFVRPEYSILRTKIPPKIDGKLDEPAWLVAPSISNFVFPWFKDGLREQSVAKLLWDDEQIYVAHVCQDQFITARHSERDGPISQDDCFEIMLTPNIDRPNFYFNIEWNVLGGVLDNHRPEGAKGPRVQWNSHGVEVAGTFVGKLNDHSEDDQYWVCEVSIPLSNFAKVVRSMPPRAGDVWYMNLNRHGGDRNQQFSQWSPGDSPAPAFHTPHRFGKAIFSGQVVPF